METSDPEKGRIPEWYYQLQIEFGKKLHRAGRVAEEFRRLCQDGCDPRELEHRLFKLTRLPRQRFAKKYTSKHLQKLLALAARLIKTSKELDFFDALLVYASIGGLTGTREFLDWERPVEIPKTLTRLAERLKQCAAGARSSRRAFPSLYDAMPPIVEYVRSA